MKVKDMTHLSTGVSKKTINVNLSWDNEQLEKQPKKDKLMSFKVALEKKQEIEDFCETRGWKVSAFMRVAIDESMTKLKSEGQ